jgi:hypothetical protein
MAARDIFHEAVKTALVTEHWRITADPLVLLVYNAERQEVVRWID